MYISKLSLSCYYCFLRFILDQNQMEERGLHELAGVVMEKYTA